MSIPERTRYDLASNSVSSTLRQLVQFANSATSLTVVNQTTKIGFWSDVDGAAQVQRFRERMFIGGATLFPDTRANAHGGWLTSSTGANWAVRDAQVAVVQSRGGLAIVGYTQTSDNLTVPTSASAIGVAGFVRANGPTRSGWAGYFDVQYESGFAGYGIEIAVKNKSSNLTSTPYLGVAGAIGLWLNTGDDSYGGAPVNPNNSAIQVGKSSVGLTWNKGIVFYGDGLTRDGSGRGHAIDLGYKHHITWYKPDNTVGLYITSQVNSGANGSSIQALSNGVYFLNGSGQVIGAMYNDQTDQAENYFSFRPGVSGGVPPRIFAEGVDYDIDLEITPKGAGVVRFGTHTATPLTISGYVTIKDAAGTTRKLAVVT